MDNHTERIPLRDQTNDSAVNLKRQRIFSNNNNNNNKETAFNSHHHHHHNNNNNNNNVQHQQQQAIVSAAQRKRPVLEGEEFKEWQAIWRRTMRESVIYFYGDDGNNSSYRLETEKLKHALKQLGARISPFFDSDVTIIISRKLFDRKLEYKAGHVFHSAKLNGLKVWSYEKVFRFLKNLGEPSPQLKKPNHHNQDLSVLLTQERLHGPIDRDPNARRDDFHYLKGLYFYCFDLRQVYRPVAVREWSTKPGQDEDTAGFPQLYASTNGRCPFQDDPVNENSTKKKLQRLRFFEENKEFRHKLIRASTIKHKRSFHEMNDSDSDVDDSFYKSSSSSSTLDSPSSEVLSNDDEQPQPNQEPLVQSRNNVQKSLMVAPDPPMLMRESSLFNSNNMQTSGYSNSNQNTKYFEIQASGMNNQSTAISLGQSQQDFGNNGLAPSRAEVMTKSFKNLNKKVTRLNKSASLKDVIDLKRKREEQKSQTNKEKEQSQLQQQLQQQQQQQQQQAQQQQEKTVVAKLKERRREVVKTAGYCESCRVKYDDFDQHIGSTKHRSFALKDSNFEQIDDLIRKIHDTNILHS